MNEHLALAQLFAHNTLTLNDTFSTLVINKRKDTFHVSTFSGNEIVLSYKTKKLIEAIKEIKEWFSHSERSST